MAMNTTKYRCSLSLADYENGDCPIVNPLLHFQSLLQQDSYFVFRISFDHVLQFSNTPLATYKETLIKTRRQYFTDSSSITRGILSRMGIASKNYIEHLVSKIPSVVWEGANKPCYVSSRVLTLSIHVSAETIPFYVDDGDDDDDDDDNEDEEEDDDDEIVEHATRESVDQVQNWMVPAAKWSIEALEELNDVELMSLDTTQEQCSICLGELSFEGCDDHQKVVEMPCSHVYHKDCVVRWLETSHFCPLCRFPMPT